MFVKPTIFFCTLSALSIILFPRLKAELLRVISAAKSSSYQTMAVTVPSNQTEWRNALESLPSTPEKIPAFFFAHGSPMLSFPPGQPGVIEWMGPAGPLAKFLPDFGSALLRKYKPRAIVVFSAHWETSGERLVTEYGSENPLLMDYYGFQKALYELKFRSKGDAAVSQRVVQLFKDAGYLARTTSKSEPRGQDGRGYAGPGFDHGVFIPFRLMFGEEFMDVPIIQVSIDSSMKPEDHWKLGQTVAPLREEGVLILSGGLPIHNLRDFSSFSPDQAKPVLKEFHQAIVESVSISEGEARKKGMFDLVKHRGFRAANPREEHFVPLYVAAGAGETGGVKVLNGLYGIPTVAFGL